MPDIDPDNLMSQRGIPDTVRFLLAELYSNLIVAEMSPLVRVVLFLICAEAMTQSQINTCVYRVPPPTISLWLLAWIRHAIGELWRDPRW